MSKNLLPQFTILEDTLNNKNSYYFYNPVVEIIANDKKSLELAFYKLKIFQKKKLFLVGYISYEASYYLDNNLKYLRHKHYYNRLLHFVAFKNYSNTIPNYSISNKNIDLMIDSISFLEYKKKFLLVKDALINGESYQVNLTKNILAKTKLNGEELYNKLKQYQLVKYAAYLPFLNPDIISISPELFFKKNNDYLTVKPMKGTVSIRNNNLKKLKIYKKLLLSVKNKAENLIIVDLLRNDLSIIAKTHSTKVEKLFLIEKYKNLLQMVSQISAIVDKKISFRKIIKGLFPCGSITGAPKKKTIELIKQIENNKRGIYTGIIGYIMPNNDMCFNVAIRTIQKYKNILKIGVGGGITVYSDVKSEWQEMNDKINFIRKIYNPNFCLVESIYYCNVFRNLELHLNRMKNSAMQLFFNINIENIKKKLLNYTRFLKKNIEYKIRIKCHYNNYISIKHNKVNTFNKNIIMLMICPKKINSNNKLFQHKTTHNSTRGFYIKMHEKYINQIKNCELLYINENNNITETRFHNIILRKNNKLYTPRVDDGILPGIKRKSLIIEGKLKVRSLTVEDLKLADNIYLINNIQGIIPAYLKE